MTLLPGTRLGAYEITAPIGVGGMGEVWRAFDTRLGRAVAVKVLPAEFASNAERLRRFEREARAMAALSHPNILNVHDVGTFEGVPYLVEELLEGEPLGDRLRRGPLPVREASRIAVQIARGLAAAHEKGIVHRDLKPGNVFLTNAGMVKILDFGLAKLVQTEVAEEPETETHARTAATGATEAGRVLGTVEYMAPEQACGQPVDQRADLFALGCVLYEMLAGVPPFTRKTRADTTSAILHDDPPPLSGARRAVPAALSEIVTRCLEKQPSNRFSSAHDLALALEALSTSADDATTGVPRPGGHRWRWSLAFGVPALLVVLVASLDPGDLRSKLLGGRANRIRSLAVLPLTNLSGDPAQEYFSDGMTEELTATLSQISALKVISRTSAMQFKATKKPLREVAAALGVDGVIEGSVLSVGDRVRITAQLITAATDTHVWAQSYERDLKDVLTLQNDVARTIAAELRATLTPHEQSRLAGGRQVNPEAYRRCLEGRHLLWTSITDEGFGKAVERFQGAIDLDPTYAPAYAGLALCYNAGAYSGTRAAYESLPLARTAAQRALALDPGLGVAHAVLGQVAFQADWDWAAAEGELQKAIALDPNNADVHQGYGFFLMTVSRYDEAVAAYGRARELDPLTPGRTLNIGFALYYARRYEESIATLRKSLETNSADPWSRMILGSNFVELGRRSDARVECDQAVAALPDDQNVLAVCGRVYGLAGVRAQALELLDRLKALSARRYIDPYNMAWILDSVGDVAGAMDWLERSFTERSAGICGVGSEHWTTALRENPRFQRLLRVMNHPAAKRQ